MSSPQLSIAVESMKRVELVTVAGRIDSSNASELDDALKEIIKSGKYNIVLNLNGVNYMSSAGLRALVAALRECKKHRGNVVISDPSQRVAEVLDLAGLTVAEAPLFRVYDDNITAVGSF
ncbi:MAG: STAS domain-containing protein [Candidatus Promineifilaceae bacterium]|nr:STAS domain-containing protein [Candidatus Promineifilaceae bacterium]